MGNTNIEKGKKNVEESLEEEGSESIEITREERRIEAQEEHCEGKKKRNTRRRKKRKGDVGRSLDEEGRTK